MADKHQLFLQIARCFAAQSTCCRKQVGAVLVKDGRIISTGYNGTISGQPHCNENPRFQGVDWAHLDVNSPLSLEHHQFSAVEELHAEQNVIAFAAKNGVSTAGCTMYITMAPCSDCSKLIAAAGIKAVYYIEEYDRCSSGVDFLAKCGITSQQMSLLE